MATYFGKYMTVPAKLIQVGTRYKMLNILICSYDSVLAFCKLQIYPILLFVNGRNVFLLT